MDFDKSKPCTRLAAFCDFFNLRTSDEKREFMVLSEASKQEIATGLRDKNGYNIENVAK